MFHSSEEAMAGQGWPVTGRQATRELRRHSCDVRDFTETHVTTRTHPGEPWETLPLNSKAILEWLGY